MTEQVFTIKTAAEATGKSEDQIRRAIRAKKVAASTDPTTRGYLITLGALLEAGFTLQSPPPADTTLAPPASSHELERTVAALEATVRELRDRIAEQSVIIERLTASLPALTAGNRTGERWWRKKANR